MKNENPTRKHPRLKGYDYSQNGAYFITICVNVGRDVPGAPHILGRIVGDDVRDVPICELSDYGRIVEKRIEEMNGVYDDMNVEKYVIMPNHIHLIICVNTDGGTSRTPSPTNAKIPGFISTFKRFTNKECGISIWQRSYHDRIIRNDEEYLRIWKYIDENPIRWTEDQYYNVGDGVLDVPHDRNDNAPDTATVGRDAPIAQDIINT